MEAECQNQGPPGASREATGLPEGQLVHHCGAFDETPFFFFWGGEGANRIMSMYRMKQNQAKRQTQRVPPLKGCSSGPEGD